MGVQTASASTDEIPVVRKLRSLSIYLALGGSAIAAQPQFAENQPRRVAVLDFGDQSVSGDTDVGRRTADLLRERFANGFVFSTPPRPQRSKGEPLPGVEATVAGTVTRFEYREATPRPVGLARKLTKRVPLVGMKDEPVPGTANVAIVARLMNGQSGEVLATVRSEGEASGLSPKKAKPKKGVPAPTPDLLGKALADAVAQLADALQSHAADVPEQTLEAVHGVVADVSAERLIVNLGANDKIKPGQRLQIRRKSKQVVDPETKQVIRDLDEKLGEIRVIDVDAQSCSGRYYGMLTPKVGDLVRRP